MRAPRRAFHLWTAILGIVLMGAGSGCSEETPDYPELITAGNWLARHASPGARIYSQSSKVAKEAGGEHRELPTGDYDTILDAIVTGQGDWLVLGEGPIQPATQSVLPLLMDKGVAWNDPRLRPVYIDNKSVNRRVLIFRVDRPGGATPISAEKEIKARMSILTHTEDHMAHAMLAMRSSRWEIAAGEFAYVVERDSTNAVAHNNRAWCILQTGRWLHLAEANAQSAVELDPTNTDYLDTLAEVLQAVGKIEDASFVRARHDSLTALSPERPR